MIVSKLLTSARALVSDEKGVTAVEYGVIGALIIVVCIVTITALGTRLDVAFQQIRDALPAA